MTKNIKKDKILEFIKKSFYKTKDFFKNKEENLDKKLKKYKLQAEIEEQKQKLKRLKKTNNPYSHLFDK